MLVCPFEVRQDSIPMRCSANQARDAGWHITVHAGEAAGPESIWQAIRELGAERIGHGVKAVEDPALMDYLAAAR